MRTRLAFLVVLLIVPILLGVSMPADGSPSGVPRLELRAASQTVDFVRHRKRDPVLLDLGVYLASHEAPFEIRVRRASYDDPIEARQAFRRPGGVRFKELPTALLDGWWGFARFLRFHIYRNGVPLHPRVISYCPAGSGGQRVDDSGPFEQTYPYRCSAFPLSLGTVWGIDRGWAAAPEPSGFSMRLPDGRYRAVVSITDAYRTLFSIHDEDASVTIAFTVRTVERRAPRSVVARPVRAGHERDTLTVAPVTEQPRAGTLPDLVALPAFWISPNHSRGRDYLTFGANVWNGGPAPLVVEGFRAEGEDRMDAYQYFFRRGEIVGRASVGSFHFDKRMGHGHWHFEQFVRYRLLDNTMTSVVRSHKQSFCVAPTDGIDLTVEGAIWRPESFGFTQCGGATSLWIRQMLPTGWGDTYVQWMGGQSFDITRVPNGTYWIEVRANPTGSLFDSNGTNDVEYRQVILKGSPGQRTATVPPWHGIDT
jgi:hypothetical protein